MKNVNRVAAAVLAAAMRVSGASAALAKAHDQGRADGSFGADNAQGARTTIDALTDLGALDGNGVSALTKGGARGAAASEAKGGNRIDPVVPD